MNNDWNDIKYAWKHKTFWEKCCTIAVGIWYIPQIICVYFWYTYVLGTWDKIRK